jgi:hypothetical protein
VTATFEMDGLSVDAWGRLANGRWCLCLGAGINGHLMPDWPELTRRVVNESNGTAFDPAQFKSLVEDSRWNLDAWIQQALNRHIADGKSPSGFNEYLRDALYRDFLRQADRANLRDEAAKLLSDPQRIGKRKFDSLISFLKSQFHETTVYKLADLFTQLEHNKLSSAMLNFNADVFFQSIFFGSSVIRVGGFGGS